MVGAERTDYEMAVRAALPFLRHVSNVEALVGHYTRDRSPEPNHPTLGSVEAWALAACRATHSRRRPVRPPRRGGGLMALLLPYARPELQSAA